MEKEQNIEYVINGARYYQPECNCVGAGHICYLRPVPSVIATDLRTILNSSEGSSSQEFSQPTVQD